MSKTAFAVGTAMGQFLHDGIVAVARAIPDMINAAIDAADQMRDLSIRTGAMRTLSKWACGAADRDGHRRPEPRAEAAVEERHRALDPKSQQAGLFKALGVSRDALSDLEKLVPAVADAFKKLPDGPQKAAVAMELFPRLGRGRVPRSRVEGSGRVRRQGRAPRYRHLVADRGCRRQVQGRPRRPEVRIHGTGDAGRGRIASVLDDIVKWAQEFIADGTNAKEIAADLAATFGRSRCRRRRDRASDRDHR